MKPVDKILDRLRLGQPGMRVTRWQSEWSSDGSGPVQHQSYVWDTVTDTNGMTNSNEFRWNNQLADALYERTMNTLSLGSNYSPEQVEMMLGALAEEALALNPEAQWSLTQLAELTSQLEQIEGSASSSEFPNPMMANDANDIRTQIQSWARDQNRYMHSLPASRDYVSLPPQGQDRRFNAEPYQPMRSAN